MLKWKYISSDTSGKLKNPNGYTCCSARIASLITTRMDISVNTSGVVNIY